MDSHALKSLKAQIRGPVIQAEDPTYDVARAVYNAMIDCRPRMVVRARDEADVMAVLGFARNTGTPLAVRGGGHSVPGYGTCDGGVVLDLSLLRNVRVDPDRRTARVGGGALLGDLDHATHAFGLATPAGFNSTTGVGGLTLGGGVSAYLGRKYGLTCDNLLSADVITAAGERITASEEVHPDLFWALRGGGGNFGVVTSFEFRLHPVENVLGGPIFFELESARDLMGFYQDFIQRAPREMGGFMGFHRAPPLPFIPEERHGDPLFVIVTSWAGAPEDGVEYIEAIREAGPVVGEHVDLMPYPGLQSAFDGLIPPGLHNYWKADFVRELTEDAVEAHMAHASGIPNVHSGMHLYPMDGAVQDVAQDATAFPFREAAFALNIVGMWPDPAHTDANRRWVRDYYAAVHPHSGYEAGYTNFMAADDGSRIRENYGAAYQRLTRVKAIYDPENLFRLNQNIQPAENA